MDRRRRPWVAFLLSWLFPGLGHLYAGRVLAALFAACLAFSSLLLLQLVVLGPHLRRLSVLLVWPTPALVVIGIAVHAWWSARRAPCPYVLKPFNRWYIYIVISLTAAALFEFGVQPWLRGTRVEAFRIPSGSMEPAALVGEFVYVDKRPKVRRGIGHGAIVTFSSVTEPGLMVIQRVVGLPGDTLAMKAGRLVRNGLLISESYARHTDVTKSEDPEVRAQMQAWQARYLVGLASADNAPDLQDWGPLVVPESSYFMLGDNREHAYDSRYWGFVPAANIRGQPRLVYWSYDTMSSRPLPFLTAARWGRIGQRFDAK